MSEIQDFFRGLFSTEHWPARWECGYWSNFHGWLYIISELMIWTAYFLIPLIILNYFFKKQSTIKFRKVYLLFATFILLCGSTHFFDALMFWVPMYRFNALLRLATGVVSLFTVYHLMQILSDAFKQKTSVELEKEIVLRKDAERKLAEANKGLEAFAYVASHDLQEPLRKIRMFNNMLHDHNTEIYDQTSVELSEKINKSSERMQRLVQDVLALSTFTGEVEQTEVNVEDAVHNAMEDLEVKIQEKNAIIEVHPLPTVKGNEAYLSQLFYNLINNSIKFSERQPHIVINGEQKDDRVFITVADNGIGMKEQDLDKIFQAFQRLHPKTAYEGTGIGLAICKRIAEILNGDIIVNSKENEGTVFTIELQAPNVDANNEAKDETLQHG